jgi:signal transduction histidine kinase
MVYQIVKNHQGEIDIKRKDDKGTVVTLDIPVYLKPEMEG